MIKALTTVASFLFLFVLLAVPSARAQDTATINPEAVEFESPVLDTPGITEYRVELFVAGADPARDVVVASRSFPPGAQQTPGRLRVELKELVLEVPNGRYIAVVRAVAGEQSFRTAPSAPFVLSRTDTVDDRLAERAQDRRWTKIAVIIGASLLLLPYVF